MPTALKNLEVNEISGVDRGANQGAKAVLVKRDFTDDERKAAAASGAALPDGSFPIKDAKDVKDAVDDFGRSGSKPEVKVHIIARAKTLGATDALPANWKVEKRGLGQVFTDATSALRKSLHSIFAGNTALPLGDTSIDQFAATMGAAIAKADIAAASNGDIAKLEKTEMTTITLEKALEELALIKAKAEKDEADRKEKDCETEKRLATLAKENAILKMSDKHKTFHGKLSGDAADKFAAMPADERDDYISKNPVEKALPAEIVKQLAEAEDTKKRLETLEKKDQLVTFGKRAVAIGMPEAFGETLQKAHAGDKDAIVKLEDTIKALVAQTDASSLFKEFGNKGADANDPVAKMDAAIAEVQKADPKLDRGAAILKIAETAAYAPVWKAYKEAGAGQTAA